MGSQRPGNYGFEDGFASARGRQEKTGEGGTGTYLILNNPLNSCAFLPTNVSPSTAPAMTLVCFGRPARFIPLISAAQWR
jgi:hypothetical protein